MKTSVFLAATGAILAAASPLLQERKVVVVEDVVEEWVTVTVTEGHHRPTMFRPGGVRVKPTSSSSSSEISSSEISSTSSTTVPEPTVPVVVDVPPVPPVVNPPVVDVPAAPAPPVIEVPTNKPSTPPPTQDLPAGDDYVSIILRHHNVHRSNHSAPGLTWGSSYADYALTTAKKCRFEHDLTPGGGGYGQNLAMYGTTDNAAGMGAGKAGAQATSNFWYNGELNKFPTGDYGKGTPNMVDFHEWGHLTQVIWAGTQQVGCASYLCAAGTIASMPSWFTVCNYFPAGNMGGAYAKNVFPPQGQPSVSA